MIGLDSRKHRNIGAVAQQGGIGFISLGDKGLTGAAVGVGARAIELAADGKGRIETCVLHRTHGHRRSGRFAVRAG